MVSGHLLCSAGRSAQRSAVAWSGRCGVEVREWEEGTCVHTRLIHFFLQHNVFKVHPRCSFCQYFKTFAGWVTFLSMCIPHSVYLFIYWWIFTLLKLSPIGSNASVNICVEGSLQIAVFNFFGHTLESGIAGSYGNLVFNSLRTHQTVFRGGEFLILCNFN